MSCRILEEIYRAAGGSSTAAERERDKQPVILKIYIAEFPTERQIDNLNRKFQSLEIAGIAKAHEIERLYTYLTAS
jgi:hypothetical protein